MNVQRVIVATSVSVRKTGCYWSVSLIETYCESTIAGGKMHRQFTDYDDLTQDEARDVLEMIVTGPIAGDDLVTREMQLALL
uniref:Uncharacterized protein n=1 Tax=uncultured prokaryote TaxID=198431 RepID=A0A0H5Q029_9ZZZZ|nr:hypothetical protein [uncultured prokaryote]